MGKEAMLTNGNTSASSVFKSAGFKNFTRVNPMSDMFSVKRFHRVEFWCSDATNTARRFSWGLGMPIVLKSDLTTGNTTHASYHLRSGQLNLLFTAPYSPSISTNISTASIPTSSHTDCRNFTASHGLAVRSIAIEVEDHMTATRLKRMAIFFCSTVTRALHQLKSCRESSGNRVTRQMKRLKG